MEELKIKNMVARSNDAQILTLEVSQSFLFVWRCLNSSQSIDIMGQTIQPPPLGCASHFWMTIYAKITPIKDLETSDQWYVTILVGSDYSTFFGVDALYIHTAL
jgi:hypothetical protein